MNWFRDFFGLCRHEWETIETGTLERRDIVVGHYYILRCKKRGEVTTRRLL